MKTTLKLFENYKFTITTVGIIIFLSLSSSEDIHKPRFLTFENADKVIHFLMYGFLTFVYLMERTHFLKIKVKTKQTRWYYVLWIFIIGGIIEVVQPILSDRNQDIWDFLANTSGIIMAYIGFLVLRKIYSFNKIFSS
ncbi:VanZ family protein [Thermophagus sp. OGC60D27]|uniref:VanZ family protein n=1 Tax=Thermophagus sp. OGC60D27 TaxID=3458415 RepID=UPI004037ECC2